MKRLVAWIGLIAWIAVGCADGVERRPTSPVVTAPSLPDSPAAALRTLEWSWIHRDSVKYGQVLAEEFRFAFAAWDTAGNYWQAHPWGRAEELRSFGHLLHGGEGIGAPMHTVDLAFESAFVEEADPRPGRSDTRYFRAIRTAIRLQMTDMNGSLWSVSCHGLFYLARGDAAGIPPESRAVLAGPDSTAWLIERWEDEPTGYGPVVPARVTPSRNTTIGGIKALFL